MKKGSQFIGMKSSSNIFEVALFLLSSLVTCPSFMSTSILVLELRQFWFIRDWSEILKLDIWTWEQFIDTKFCKSVSHEKLLNVLKLSRLQLLPFLKTKNVIFCVRVNNLTDCTATFNNKDEVKPCRLKNIIIHWKKLFVKMVTDFSKFSNCQTLPKRH